MDMVSNGGNQESSRTSGESSGSKRGICTKFDFFAVTICVVYVGVAIISFYAIRSHICGTKTNNVVDSVYFTIVLMTSAGYKDLKPHTALATLLAASFALLGIFLFGVAMSLCENYFSDTQMDEYELADSALHDDTVKYPSILKIEQKVLAVALAVHMIIGTTLLISVGDMDVLNTLRCVSSTFTTVLSDDDCFTTEGSRIFAIFWILLGVTTLNGMMYIVTTTRHHQRKWLFARKNSHKIEGLESSDLDENGQLSKENFVLFMLRRKYELKKRDDEQVRDKKPEHNGPQSASRMNILPLITSNDIWNMIISFVIYFGLSTVIYYAVRDHITNKKKTNVILDALFLACVIMTSVGYGDISPRTALAYIFAVLFSLGAMYIYRTQLQIALEVLERQRKYTVRLITDQNATTLLIKDNLKMILLPLLVIMFVEILILYLTEDLGFMHALYCITITITSAGTEKCFSTKFGRSFALLEMMFGFFYKNYMIIAFTKVYIQIRHRFLTKKDTGPEPMKMPHDAIAMYLSYKEYNPKDIEDFTAKFKKLVPPGTNRLTLREILES